MIKIGIIIAFLCIVASATWIDTSSHRVARSDAPIFQTKNRFVELQNWESFHSPLFAERSIQNDEMRVLRNTIELPLPSGGMVSVRMHEYAIHQNDENSDTMRAFVLDAPEGENSDLYGSMFIGQGRVWASFRASNIENGEHVMIDPMVYQTPSAEGWAEHPSKAVHVAYLRNSYPKPEEPFVCGSPYHEEEIENELLSKNTREASPLNSAATFGDRRRVLTVAISATAQYGIAATGMNTTNSSFVSATQTAITAFVVRINEVFLPELTFTAQLVSGNSMLISTDTGDALSSANGNNANIISINYDWIVTTKGIALSSFDIGHCFTTTGGGIAYLNSACEATNSLKPAASSGVTINPYSIKTVIHEMGHQMSAGHTFNSNSPTNCAGQISPNTAVEPGAGVTIMSYGGVCPPDNLNDYYIEQYSWKSLSQMGGQLTSACAAGSANPGAVTILNISTSFTIPRQTPFMMSGFASSTSSGTGVTYSWEQAEVGQNASIAVGDIGTNPLFRPYLASEYNFRLFNSIYGLGNILPTTSRTMSFRLTARDSPVTGGHWAISDFVNVTVDVTKGPFTFSSPSNGSNVTSGAAQALSWSVASSNTLSTDLCVYLVDTSDATGGGGYCMGVLPNSGSGSIDIPSQASNGTGIIRIMGQLPNTFFQQVSVNILSNGTGFKDSSLCPSSCPVFRLPSPPNPVGTTAASGSGSAGPSSSASSSSELLSFLI